MCLFQDLERALDNALKIGVDGIAGSSKWGSPCRVERMAQAWRSLKWYLQKSRFVNGRGQHQSRDVELLEEKQKIRISFSVSREKRLREQ